MIQAVTENTDFAGAIRPFSALDPFACRILSLYQSYRPELVFVDYWLQIDGESGSVTGAVARNGSNFILFLTDKSDLDEVSSFVRVSGAAGIICISILRTITIVYPFPIVKKGRRELPAAGI